jgi:hypothetical protein
MYLCDRRPKWLNFLLVALCDASNLYCGSGLIPLLLNAALRSQYIDTLEQPVLGLRRRAVVRNLYKLATCIDLELVVASNDNSSLSDTCRSSIFF